MASNAAGNVPKTFQTAISKPREEMQKRGRLVIKQSGPWACSATIYDSMDYRNPCLTNRAQLDGLIFSNA